DPSPATRIFQVVGSQDEHFTCEVRPVALTELSLLWNLAPGNKGCVIESRPSCPISAGLHCKDSSVCISDSVCTWADTTCPTGTICDVSIDGAYAHDDNLVAEKMTISGANGGAHGDFFQFAGCWTDFITNHCSVSAERQVIGDGRPIFATCFLS